MHKTGQSWRILVRFLVQLLKTGLTLMKHVLKPLAKSVLTPLVLTAAVALTTDAAVHKTLFWSGCPLDLVSRTTTLIICNEEINDAKSLEESCLLIKGASETFKNNTKEQKGRFAVCY